MKKYGLVGFPLTHSFSKTYFTQKFQELGLSGCRYDNYEMEDLSGLNILLQDNSLQGLNVTIPHKQTVVNFTHTLDPVARETGVVNTLKIHHAKYAHTVAGYNTDAEGFREALLPLLDKSPRQALILGTGASSKTVAWVLEKASIPFHLVSRQPQGKVLGYDALEEWLPQSTLVVNTTPAGMYPKEDNCPPLPYQLLTHSHLLFDLVYNPSTTLFLQKGKDQGAMTENGWNMLRLQAEAAWKIWNE